MSLCMRAKVAFVGHKTAPLGVVVSQRDKGTALGTRGDRLEALRKGTGGRCSFNGVVATVFGSTGFLGRYVVNALGKSGTMMVLPYRGDFFDVQRMKICGDLGQVVFNPIDIRDEKSLAKSMEHSNVVINLIGKDKETANFKFDEVHVKTARTIARLSRELGVEKLIHFSALNACEKPKRQVLTPSKFYATKWEGEQAVRQEFPDAIIFRPSDMFGWEDRFLNYYTSVARRTLHTIGLWRQGKGVQKCPVYVSDVAQAVVKAIFERGNEGEIYQAVGPKLYELGPLVDYIFNCIRRGKGHAYVRYDMRLDPLFLLRVLIAENVQKYPILGIERLEREHTCDVVDFDTKKIVDLGVKLTDPEIRFPFELKNWRYFAHMDSEQIYFDPIPPPPSVFVE